MIDYTYGLKGITFTLKLRLVSDNIWVLLILFCISWSYNTFTLYTAFVDFTKAFDYLVRDVIWHKLIK